MKTKSFKYTGIVLAVLLLFAVGPVQGQEPEPLPKGDPEGPEYILAQPPYTMNYQGYLTDSSGSPLNGTYDLAFALYDDVSTGTMEWGTETHNSTQVTNGLFQVTLGESVTLYPSYFYEALFLAVRVDGTWVSPRQPLHAVPYAFGLVPGAEVVGDPDGTVYGLYVDNTDTNPSDSRGLYARGEYYGIYATSDGKVAIRSEGYVHAYGYMSDFPSYWWYDANGMQTEDTLPTSPSGSFSIGNNWKGGVELDCSSTGQDYVLLPLDVPGELLGQDVRVEGAQVYYRTTDSNTYIARTLMYKSTGAGENDWLLIGDNTTPKSSTFATNYSIDIASGGHTLDYVSGNLLVLFDLYCDDTADDLFISGVRLRLAHDDS